MNQLPIHLAGLEQKGPGKIISFYIPEKDLEALDRVAAKLGPNKRSKIILLAIRRLIPTLERHFSRDSKVNINPQDNGPRMDRIQVLRTQNTPSDPL